MSQAKRLELYWIDQVNAGDAFAKYLVERIIKEEVILGYPGNPFGGPEVYQVTGSLASDSLKDTILLGTGVILDKLKIKTFKECHIVRGALTLRKVKESRPEFDITHVKLGDTGLLLSEFVDNMPEIPRYDIGIVVHYLDQKLLKMIFASDVLSSEKVLIINILNSDLQDIAHKIKSCKRVFSSSLHGIVFAHSLNVPVVWIRLEKTGLPIDDFKFYDYLSIYNLPKNTIHCNLLKPECKLSDLNSLPLINVDPAYLRDKKRELLSVIVRVFTDHGFTIRPEISHKLTLLRN